MLKMQKIPMKVIQSVQQPAVRALQPLVQTNRFCLEVFVVFRRVHSRVCSAFRPLALEAVDIQAEIPQRDEFKLEPTS